MPNVGRLEGLESGGRQAAEVNESHLCAPCHIDNPVITVTSYTKKAERSLRESDFDEFKSELIVFINLHNDAVGGGAEEVEKMNKHKQAAFSKIEGFPELVADFDQFLTAWKVVMRRPTVSVYQDFIAL
ncbi:hypothetical protein EDB81DRAFT_220412 [Dactylonectria macrodidyma]|uniref:Uncharacterized protein n=1 Tax=Dactylonectria macrodidyma TaxID=307937 RepID=A0A9P9DRB7_9HYPO|nr:hypothetical protein EDB81DRAFT_220412 [Dactylonectria macrodidyma]